MISSRRLAQTLITLAADYEQAKITAVFGHLLTRYGLPVDRLSLIKYLSYLAAEQERRERLTIISSHQLSETAIKKIRHLTGADKRAKAEVIIDSELIGGFRAEYQGRLFDYSLVGRLKQLKEKLST